MKLKLLTLSMMVAAGNAVATDNSDTVLVTASRLDSDTRAMPGNITVIDRNSIQNTPAKTLPELLSLEAGIFSRSLFGNNATNVSIDMRGFGAASAQNVLILLDGRRLNDIDQAAVDFSAIPLHNIERIEIIRNGGSVLYGDGAVGGSINIITRHAAGTSNQGSVALAAGNLGTRKLDADYQINSDNASLLLSAYGYDSDGYRDNNEVQQRSIQADLRLRGATGEGYIKASSDQQDTRLPGERTVDPSISLNELENDRRGTNDPNDWADQDGYNLAGGYTFYWGDNTEVVVDAGFRNKEQQSFFDFGFGFTDYRELTLETWSFTPRVITSFDNGMSATFGLDYYDADYERVEALLPGTIANPLGRVDITQQSLAIYAQGSQQLSEQTRIDLGGRLQRVETESRDTYDATAPGGSVTTFEAADAVTDDTEHMLELGIRHDWQPSFSVYGKLSRSVRFATVDEYFESKFDIVTFNSSRTFSLLDPQTSTGIDLGFDTLLGKTELNTNLYYMHLKDEIHYDVNSFDNINLDPTRRYGLEITASQPITDNLSIRGSYTYARAQFREGTYSGNEVPLVPKNTASLTGLWSVNDATSVSATVRYVGEKYFDNDQTNDFGQKIPSYTRVDVGADYDWSGWTAGADIYNLFDEEAYDYGVRSTFTAGRYNAYPLPERTFLVSVGREF